MSELQNVEIRPHHAEGALGVIASTFHWWSEISEGEDIEPEALVEMFFDAEDTAIASTSDETRMAIEAKWGDDARFQKICNFLKNDYRQGLEDERVRQIEIFQDAAAYLVDITPQEVKQTIRAKYAKNDDELYDWQLSEFRKEYEALKRVNASTADEKLLQMARNKEAYTDPNKSLFPHRKMYAKLKEAYDTDPMGATITFVNDFDFICQGCVSGGKIPPCVASFGHGNRELIIDRKVVEAHNWEFNRPYNLGEILRIMMAEVTRRKCFLTCNDYLEKPEFMETWSQDVAQSKLAT